jgi:hypothetical protein
MDQCVVLETVAMVVMGLVFAIAWFATGISREPWNSITALFVIPAWAVCGAVVGAATGLVAGVLAATVTCLFFPPIAPDTPGRTTSRAARYRMWIMAVTILVGMGVAALMQHILHFPWTTQPALSLRYLAPMFQLCAPACVLALWVGRGVAEWYETYNENLRGAQSPDGAQSLRGLQWVRAAMTSREASARADRISWQKPALFSQLFFLYLRLWAFAGAVSGAVAVALLYLLPAQAEHTEAAFTTIIGGAFQGAFYGADVGMIAGLIVALETCLNYSPLHDESRYRRIITVQGLAVSITGVLILARHVTDFTMGSGWPGIVLYCILAGLATMGVTAWTVKWYRPYWTQVAVLETMRERAAAMQQEGAQANVQEGAAEMVDEEAEA